VAEPGDNLLADTLLRLTYADARSLFRGDIDSAGALREGRIKVRGNINALVPCSSGCRTPTRSPAGTLESRHHWEPRISPAGIDVPWRIAKGAVGVAINSKAPPHGHSSRLLVRTRQHEHRSSPCRHQSQLVADAGRRRPPEPGRGPIRTRPRRCSTDRNSNDAETRESLVFTVRASNAR